MSLDNLLKKAMTKHQNGNYAGAAKQYQEILRIKPNHLDANYLLGTLYAETGNLSEAVRFLTAAEKINPDSPYIKVNLGFICKQQNDLDTSRKYFSDAIAINNGIPQAHFGLGSIYEQVDNNYQAALEEFQKALDLSANDPLLLQAVGRALLKLGNKSSIDFFTKALQIQPQLDGIHKDLGMAYLSFDKKTDAARHLAIAGTEHPDSALISYYLCIAEGREPDQELKQRYVREEFDAYADNFENSLVGQLGYEAPARIVEFLLETMPAGLHLESGIDLGCGTGLFGVQISQYVTHLTGIDISARMIAEARKRGCYETLLEGEIISTLKGLDGTYELFAATDVMIYIGDLRELFAAVREKAAANALFLLTTERLKDEGFALLKSGRYAHSTGYIQTVASANGFSILAKREIPLRKEQGEWLPGEMFILQANH